MCAEIKNRAGEWLYLTSVDIELNGKDEDNESKGGHKLSLF